MSNSVEFVLFGTPTPKSRPRFTRNGRTYTPAKTRVAEQSILAAYIVAAGARPPHDGPVDVAITATFTPPATWPKWRTARAIDGMWPHISKPDLDNLVKLLDGLNGRAWVDDSQIVSITARKRYGATASTAVVLTFHPAPTKEN